ncbi:MAG: chromosome segregation protein SMC [Planctomycetes bacterium]|nr:chromosome segregation protein SMC [Planctomycetota bacterium]
MLKALELLGFKSFAERTRFEFPQGITVVVGPNGSGKSNIVDAIKWVLGEQSVKSLRGKEMADVIFNGSDARRALNSAEVTLTFDNSSHLLPIDTPEVHVTRRVYRSGEGEYLINRQPSRLRDIREMFAGTGVTTEAYSVIEQGKVDVLLQSSPRDRRVIFEEAAGISRFKAKKIEASRRLDRVEQNLLRLSDIVDEVDSRLRGVRAQAGKARRYRQYTSRLQELRTQVGLVDWNKLTARLQEIRGVLEDQRQQRDSAAAEAEALDARQLEAETKVSQLNERIRMSESRIAANRERIAGQESTIDHQRQRCRDLEEEIARGRQNLSALKARADDLGQQLLQTGNELEEAESNHRQLARSLGQQERELTDLIARLDQVRGEVDQRRAAHVRLMREAAGLGNRISGLESRLAAASEDRRRCVTQLHELDGQRDQTCRELDALGIEKNDLTRQLDERTRALAAAEARRVELDQRRTEQLGELDQLRQRHSGASQRAALLEDLENRLEGLNAGVKEVVRKARQATDGPFAQVCGLVADLIEVNVETAPLVEVALGERAQHMVAVPGNPLAEHLQQQSLRLAGRVGFVWLDAPRTAAPAAPIDLQGHPGVLGRADRFVQTESRYEALVRHLLGDTWIVEKLADALRLAGAAAPRARFVTLAGELLEADGTLIVGPRHAAVGLISRRSELRALGMKLLELEAAIAQNETLVAELDRQTEGQREICRQHELQCGDLREALAACQMQTVAAEQRRDQFDRQCERLQGELRAAETQHEEAGTNLAEAAAQHQKAERELAEMEVEMASVDQQIDRLETMRRQHNQQTTEAKVELAKSDERLRNLRSRARQLDEGQSERSRAMADTREQLAQSIDRARQSQWNILRAESEVAELFLHKEAFAGQTVELIDARETLRGQRAELNTRTQQTRSAIRKLDEKVHAQELLAADVLHQRDAMADRMREDYGIELAELEHQPSDEEQQAQEEVNQEIEELRRKISNIGNVNLDALDELDEMETRHERLSGQYKDLADAKGSLEKIIGTINADSRRLFVETLETVKGHFQTLFRKLFGGGRADIVLDEEADILECGIEIVARPPGKEPRNISLLSGGEKTLTCVALLLAIFRSRPSPFCVLDEVDAALDEANIDRFVNVLHEFLTWTQFIMVTHSKKTMTCATTIYGVTMQESGISKQVSIRFEDVSEDGEILREAPPSDPEKPAEDDETQAA